VGLADAEDVMLPPIVVIAPPSTPEVRGAFDAEEAPLKATRSVVVAVELTETAVLLGFRMLLGRHVSMIAFQEIKLLDTRFIQERNDAAKNKRERVPCLSIT
jgi:hypothetical protein